MNENEFLKRYGTNVFTFQVYIDKTWKNVQMGRTSNAPLVIIFNQDHTLSFPSKIGFYPDERRWEFDEAKQEIIFKDESGTKITDRYVLPTVNDDHFFILVDVNDKNKHYICSKNFNFNQSVVITSALPSQRLILMEEPRSAEIKADMEDYSKKYCCALKLLPKMANDQWALINNAWSVICHDPDLQEVCVLIEGLPNLDEKVWFKKLTIQAGDNQIKLISGKRSDVIVALSQLLIMHDHQLLAQEKIAPPIELLPQIITD
ncbi:hypothetical protein PT285_04605 [Lactobacillus sp. ESL0791]|uniref:hypothetical protein n=1 Tax=Lactobacillus sp. ESL0791 TaxID=2983234 RepID=UPI0023F7A2CF|nr:hypothetical protein [Lactobacillus sp. ESL0791]MDF7638679.1 hypothetical protein [Lactobacillus sp. ESL0791]